MTSGPEPWAQREDESSPASAEFLTYRDLGPVRSLDQADIATSPSKAPPGAPGGRNRRATGRIREWAERWDWAGHAGAWDLHQRTIHEKSVRDATIRHAEE